MHFRKHACMRAGCINLSLSRVAYEPSGFIEISCKPQTPGQWSHQQWHHLPAAKKPSVPLNVSWFGAAALSVLARALIILLRAAMSSAVHPGHLQHKQQGKICKNRAHAACSAADQIHTLDSRCSNATLLPSAVPAANTQCKRGHPSNVFGQLQKFPCRQTGSAEPLATQLTCILISQRQVAKRWWHHASECSGLRNTA